MAVLITKAHTKAEIKKMLGSSKKPKLSSSIQKLAGKLKWKGDALKIQHRLRSELTFY